MHGVSGVVAAAKFLYIYCFELMESSAVRAEARQCSHSCHQGNDAGKSFVCSSSLVDVCVGVPVLERNKSGSES